MKTVRFEGVNSKVEKIVRNISSVLLLAVVAVMFAACGGTGSGQVTAGADDPAASVNGKVIKMEEVERAVKLQAQGQEAKMSPLELAGARLQVLQSLIEQEVMFQKAEKEGAVPTDDEVTAELNKQKTQSGRTADEWEKQMKDANMTEAAVRDSIKKGLAIQKLLDKITGKIEPPKDAEVNAFYEGNKELFVKKKGVKLAAIVVDPTNGGEGDVTVDEPSAVAKGNEIVKQLQAGADFAAVAREKSEDQSRFQGGDLGYIAQEDLSSTFPAEIVATLMNPQTPVGKMLITRAQGKLFILKLQERSDKDEPVTLESPGVREKVVDSLISSRKQLLQASYQAIAMNEAKIENFLAKKVVANPNELSGARPAGSSTAPANTAANTAPAANTNTNANAAPAANTNSAKPADNKPAAKAPEKAPDKAANNSKAAPANK